MSVPEVRIRHTFEISYIPFFTWKWGPASSGLLHRKIHSQCLFSLCRQWQKGGWWQCCEEEQALAIAHRPLECGRCADSWASFCACISCSLVLVIPSLNENSFGKVFSSPHRNLCKAQVSAGPVWPVRNLQPGSGLPSVQTGCGFFTLFYVD